MKPANSEQLVEIKDLCFYRGERAIFDHINMSIPRGKITAIMGPSGTGKTTLLRLIGGQIIPEQGEVWVDGEHIGELSHKGLYQLRKRMGILFQSGALLTDLNVFDNVAFPLREHSDLPDALIKTLVHMKLQSVGLRGAVKLMPSELSGGMARRVALARAIALDPMILLYDEPFTGQDPISFGVLARLIRSLNDALQLTSVIVSHDVQETCEIADYLYIIANGKVVGQGTPEELYQSDSPWVQQFLKAKPDGPVPFHYPAPDYAEDLI